jgi:hypothetical protein
MQGRLSLLCAALLHNEIYPPMNFKLIPLILFEISSGQNVWKITKGNNSKIIKVRVIILSTSFLLNKIYPPMNFHVDISKSFWFILHAGEKLSMKNNKGLISNIMKGMHCTPPEWDKSINEVSCWYLKGFLGYALDKN